MKKLIEVLKPIEATTETAFQRAIFRNGHTILGSRTKIEWLDIELPVEKGNDSRRQCVDLIGHIGDRSVLCELKFGDNSATDSPADAVFEIMHYYKCIRQNWPVLDSEGKHHPDGKPFLWKDIARPSTKLIVAANASYWAYWLGHRKVDISEFDNVAFYSLDVPCNVFKSQKGNKPLYVPTIVDIRWTIL